MRRTQEKKKETLNEPFTPHSFTTRRRKSGTSGDPALPPAILLSQSPPPNHSQLKKKQELQNICNFISTFYAKIIVILLSMAQKTQKKCWTL